MVDAGANGGAGEIVSGKPEAGKGILCERNFGENFGMAKIVLRDSLLVDGNFRKYG